MNYKEYIPIEKMSTEQYMRHIEVGYWGGTADPQVLEMIKDNPDNPLIDNDKEIEPLK